MGGLPCKAAEREGERGGEREGERGGGKEEREGVYIMN